MAKKIIGNYMQTISLSVGTIADKLSSEKNRITFYLSAIDGWFSDAQSSFIDSILAQVPMQPILLDARDENDWEVKDGKRRIVAIYHFIVKQKLQLSDMKFFPELNGKSFSELNTEQKDLIKNAVFPCHLILPGTPDDVAQHLIRILT